MLCKKCKEQIDVGEAMRAEAVEAGSNHHHVYHTGCYLQVKEERQRDQLELPLPEQQERQAQLARKVC